MLPLAGVRVIAVEQYGAGPFGSMLLGDLGAEVIKIENPAEGGDVGRSIGPHFFGPGDSHFFQAFNRNKRSVTLDMKHPEARGVFRELVRSADAVFDNLRGDQSERLGTTYAQLSDVKPDIVCVHLSAYGRDGSRKAWPGYDYLMQAEAGYLALTGEPEGPPARCGLSIVDYMAGLYAAYALVAGVLSARATGVGRDLDVSLFDGALQNLAYLAVWYLNAGVNQGRAPRSSHPSLTPSQLYRTGDGYIFIMCNKEKFWPILCERIGRPDWAERPEYKNFEARLANRALLTEELDAVLSERTTSEWLERFAGQVPAAPVHDVAAALDNPFVREGGRVVSVPHPKAGEIRVLAPPVSCPGEELRCTAAPQLGADTDSVLGQLGFAPGEIARLRTIGVV
ncbi:MAG TPA: CoA transferase [Beijerinckiaceae bacterium]|jgi:crotonobetainyl-CoA:carnitine CoA-transferase CaiB-like acyl-CoA transferase